MFTENDVVEIKCIYNTSKTAGTGMSISNKYTGSDAITYEGIADELDNWTSNYKRSMRNKLTEWTDIIDGRERKTKLEGILHHEYGLCEGKTETTVFRECTKTDFFYKRESSMTEWYPVFEGSGNSMTIPNIGYIANETPMEARRRKGAPGLTVISRKRKALRPGAANEERARQLLRRFVGNDRFRRYLRDGFIVFCAKSGRDYQLFPGYGITQVWEKGEIIERLCLVMQDSKLPPTDSVVMRILLLEHDEEDFRDRSIKHSVPARNRRAAAVA